jgi:hypothetical protein
MGGGAMHAVLVPSENPKQRRGIGSVIEGHKAAVRAEAEQAAKDQVGQLLGVAWRRVVRICYKQQQRGAKVHCIGIGIIQWCFSLSTATLGVDGNASSAEDICVDLLFLLQLLCCSALLFLLQLEELRQRLAAQLEEAQVGAYHNSVTLHQDMQQDIVRVMLCT